ncbi:MAG: VPLPA-CTERM sorting domain-containing protein [Gammaproteobacteria bacterium]|nr:VPLPA-CTERM sorting domain-containing protein [Gammaproteobacteria bacterium]
MKKMHKLAAVAVIATAPGLLNATPLYDQFGPFASANFGGTGIPNDSVAVSRQIEDGVNTITLAMNATQRFFNPAVTNDGAGTFYALAGSNTGGPGSTSSLTGALWNFNYYIDVSGPGAKLTDYDITLYYDFNPAFDNGPVNLGMINVTNSILASPNPLSTNEQGSQNLMFSFLATSIPGFITAPGGAFTSFNPNALGEYNFAIQVTRAGWSIEQVRMDVQVIPVPAAVWLFGSALGLVGLLRRRASA